jgi:predicted PurR-regulated permease PerM
MDQYTFIVFGSMVTAALAVIGFLAGVIFSGFQKKLNDSVKKAVEIEKNYLTRFEETNKNIHALGDKITEKLDTKIDSLSEELRENYVTKDFCKAIHGGN